MNQKTLLYEALMRRLKAAPRQGPERKKDSHKDVKNAKTMEAETEQSLRFMFIPLHMKAVAKGGPTVI